ncbi:cytochrome P450 [Roridomyces roridus]|uniref:Cytochrome P450 n=1 Tax=Roridomyces roridus TaxID=1738132 RepID=A0AAD7FD57_9AGAR|nr:cytochrome P450 [Roridomyces roridus]
MATSLSFTEAAALAIVLMVGIHALRARSSSEGRRPPGPRGFPILGNLLQIPGQHPATYFRKLFEEYGGLVSLNVAGFPIILVGNMTLAKELLEKRSAKFSSRQATPYSRCYDPDQNHWPVHSGKSHFIGRKLSASIMTGVRAGETEPLQQFEALISATRILDDRGSSWFHEVERTAASMVLTAGFGFHCPTGDEPELKELLACIADIIVLSSPNGSIINALPFLDKIPGIPKPWRVPADAFRRREEAVYGKLVTRAVSGEAAGMNTWAALFASEDKPEGDQRRLMNPFATAAIETTASSLQAFVLACILHPQWIARAQAQIDTIVGPDRIPTFQDRARLPWIEAVVRETHRWRPALRFGLPHKSTADDIVEYQGQEYYIPKGSIVLAVTMAIEHDQNNYENPDEFHPERFLDDKGQLKGGYETSAFGFGRRLCSGLPFAERSLWINIAMMLWAFNIHKSEERDSRTGLPFEYSSGDEAFFGGVTNAPLPFPAVFQPRTAHHEEVIREEWANCEKDLNVLLQHKTEIDK